MELKLGRIKYLGEPYKKYIKKSSSRITRIGDLNYNGYIGYMKIYEVNYPFIVELDGKKICLYNDGYNELCYLPDNENWMVWAIYDNNGKIIEWYFDITKENSIDKDGKPYCDDLYLDIVLMPDGKIIVLDEDELKDAYNSKTINEEEYKLAYRIKDKLIEEKIIDVEYMEKLCEKLFGVINIEK
jgi:predicted RNA-binding protein associated with RNAse of E/G family